jgi:hypothetical protein
LGHFQNITGLQPFMLNNNITSKKNQPKSNQRADYSGIDKTHEINALDNYPKNTLFEFKSIKSQVKFVSFSPILTEVKKGESNQQIKNSRLIFTDKNKIFHGYTFILEYNPNKVKSDQNTAESEYNFCIFIQSPREKKSGSGGI